MRKFRPAGQTEHKLRRICESQASLWPPDRSKTVFMVERSGGTLFSWERSGGFIRAERSEVIIREALRSRTQRKDEKLLINLGKEGAQRSCNDTLLIKKCYVSVTD